MALLKNGLYSQVNDDIVFDNWDGIWDKHYAIGKWTGLKPLPNGKWNETHIWMNWEDLPVRSHDLKVILKHFVKCSVTICIINSTIFFI